MIASVIFAKIIGMVSLWRLGCIDKNVGIESV